MKGGEQDMRNAVIVILVLITAGAGFFFGMKYQQSKQPSRADFQARIGMRQSVPGAQQRPEGSEAVRGEIIDKDETSITVKLPDDSSKIVLISENTAINKATEGSVDDLETGEQVVVFGQENSDGSITAQNIQLNPILR